MRQCGGPARPDAAATIYAASSIAKGNMGFAESRIELRVHLVRMVPDGTGFFLHDRGARSAAIRLSERARGHTRPVAPISPHSAERQVRIAFGIMGGWNPGAGPRVRIPRSSISTTNISSGARNRALHEKTLLRRMRCRSRARVPQRPRGKTRAKGHKSHAQRYSDTFGGGQAVMRDTLPA